MMQNAVTDTTSATETVAAPDLQDPALYYNRELSWMQFNERVLELAEDTSVPLLERVKFCAIYSSNLDEFFMIRVAGLHDQVEAGVAGSESDGGTPPGGIAALPARVFGLDARQARVVERELLPALSEHGVAVAAIEDLSDSMRETLA